MADITITIEFLNTKIEEIAMNYKQLALGLEELNDELLSNTVILDPVYFLEYANGQVIDKVYHVFPREFVETAFAITNGEIDQYGTDQWFFDNTLDANRVTLSKKNRFLSPYNREILDKENMRNHIQYTLFRNIFLVSALFAIQNDDGGEFFENGEPKEHTQTLLNLFDTSDRDTYLPMTDGEYDEAEKSLYKLQSNEQTGLSEKMLEDLERFGVFVMRAPAPEIEPKVTLAELQTTEEREAAEQLDLAFAISLAEEPVMSPQLTQEEREAAEQLDLVFAISLAETDDGKDKHVLEEDDDLELLATAQMLPEEELLAQQTLLLAFRQQRRDSAPSPNPNPSPNPGF